MQKYDRNSQFYFFLSFDAKSDLFSTPFDITVCLGGGGKLQALVEVTDSRVKMMTLKTSPKSTCGKSRMHHSPCGMLIINGWFKQEFPDYCKDFKQI